MSKDRFQPGRGKRDSRRPTHCSYGRAPASAKMTAAIGAAADPLFWEEVSMKVAPCRRRIHFRYPCNPNPPWQH
jgi:hypothetical protein